MGFKVKNLVKAIAKPVINAAKKTESIIEKNKDTVAAVATGGLSMPFTYMDKQQDNMIKAQKDMLNQQIGAEEAARKKQEEEAIKLGASATKIQDENVAETEEEKKRRLAAMQNGILGTMRTNPLSLLSSAVSTRKATLGS